MIRRFAQANLKANIPIPSPAPTPRGTAIKIALKVIMALSHRPNIARYSTQAPTSSPSPQSFMAIPTSTNNPSTAIHGNGGSTASAPGSVEKENPSTSRLLTKVSGQFSTQETERVISLNVKIPKSRSLISQLIKSLIQSLSGTTQPRGYFIAQGHKS